MIDRPHRFTIRSTDDRRARARAAREGGGRGRRAARWRAHGPHPRLRRADPRVGAGRATRRGLAPRAAAGRRVARIGLQLPRAPMTSTLVSLTFRALLNRRRTLLLALLGVLIVAWPSSCASATHRRRVAPLHRRLLGQLRDRRASAARAVIVGTAALGSELDDGTIVYLLAKPVARSRIVLVKVAVAWMAVSASSSRRAICLRDRRPRATRGWRSVHPRCAPRHARVHGRSSSRSRWSPRGRSSSGSRTSSSGRASSPGSSPPRASCQRPPARPRRRRGARGVTRPRSSPSWRLGLALAVIGIVTVLAVALAVRRLARVELRGETA